ncbi:F-box protein [Abeliophyllum distichum]|uniref:F-box protein n=1 Tax=Abeliophyllum distichum TaxID=126358 RepID=A0ABD1PPP0_9LAMI
MEVSDWSNLPDELKVDILCRMPDKNLIRLKCVCKSWYFFISNSCAPRFSSPSPSAVFCGLIYLRRSLQSGKTSLTLSPQATSLGDVANQLSRNLTAFEHNPEDILDCCNGLFLLASRSSNPTQYYVTNPTISECITIPVNPLHGNFEYASLAFDPTVTLHYKIIRFSRINPSLNLDVFSSETGDWACHAIALEPMLDLGRWNQTSVYLNGVLYRLSVAKYMVCINLKLKEHIKTNVNLKAQTIELPQKDKFDRSGSIGTSRGALLYLNNDNYRIKIWMFDDSCRWVLKHRTNFPHVVFTACGDFSLLKFYAFHPNKDEIFVGISQLMITYDLNANKVYFFNKLRHDEVILCDKYYILPYSRCGVVLNSVIKSH